jgi:cytochrome c-type biogenesis protein CcmH
MVAKLEARLKQQPDDREGWMMLGRAYGVMGRDQEAVGVYRKVLELSPADPATQSQAHADLGRAIGKAAGRKMTPEADAELKKALKLDPGNVMAHALLGRADFERGEVVSARKHWQQALDGVDSGHPFAQQLRQSIELADNVVKAQAGKALPPDAGSAPPPTTQLR